MNFGRSLQNSIVAKVIFVLCGYTELIGQPAAHIDSMYAPSLGRTKTFVVLLPSGYDPSQRYPVLYLLHGWGGSSRDWTSKTNIQKYVENFPLIVVMPDAENSWYVNSYAEAQNRFEDYLINDVPRYIQHKYAVDTTRQSIAGLSMGGYGAIMLALKHHKKFLFTGSLSGAIAIPREIDNRKDSSGVNGIAPSLRKAFGETENSFRTAHDPFVLYKNASPDLLPYIYLVIGIQDGYPTFLPRHREFTDSLRAYGAAYEYHETPGKHSWQFWDREIQPLLRRMRQIMKF